MIQQITKLKNFGIFQDYKPLKELKPFAKYNLFYGWNGSGKSTLAKLFFSIADKKIHKHFPSSEFCIEIKDQSDLTHKNIETNSINIKVFNKDFVERNVNFEQSKANSILILSEEKKEEIEKYKLLQQQLDEQNSIYQIDKNNYDKSVDTQKKNLSKWASNIKKSFELIETSNTQLLNYNITKLNNFIREHRNEIKQDSILTQEDVKNLKAAIKPNPKPDIIDELSVSDAKEVDKLFLDLKELLNKSIFSQQIERLKENPDINQWVKTGLDIHNFHKSDTCEFCGQNLPNARIEQLNNHFSRDYLDLIQRLDIFKKRIEELFLKLSHKLPEAIEFYDEFQNEYQKEKIVYFAQQEICIDIVEQAKEKIYQKIANPFEIIDFSFSSIENTFDKFNNEVSNIKKIIRKHNIKNQQFEEEVKKAQSKLELHFISEILLEEKYFETEQEIINKKIALEQFENELKRLEVEIMKTEAILINEVKGAEKFNNNLARFIGRKDISLEFDKDLKGYKLIRAGKSEPATNLSEGEKTAIAFVYFIAKLKENRNQIENSIIVVDDPISSFDSNHLFQAYSYLKQECENALQLFILTHNFQFFKLNRDWLLKKNERKRDSDGTIKEKIRSHFYSLECTVEEDRNAIINNANNTLLDFNSEYHYIFYRLYQFKELKSLDLEKAFLIANLSRKLLEGFLTFKFPKGRNDFSQLLQAGCSDADMREKVYRFINKYSHNQQIEFHDTSIDNLLGEGQNIIEAVFKIVTNLDKQHFLEMEEVCCAVDND